MNNKLDSLILLFKIRPEPKENTAIIKMLIVRIKILLKNEPGIYPNIFYRFYLLGRRDSIDTS